MKNKKGITHSVILIGYIICFLNLINRFRNNGGFDYSASRSLYYMILALSCFISVIYLKEIVKANKKFIYFNNKALIIARSYIFVVNGTKYLFIFKHSKTGK